MSPPSPPSPPASSAPSSPPQTDTGHWLRTAREVADDLATDAVARDQAGKSPHEEVARLREAGLLELLIPTRRGGSGADWPTAHTVLREIAAADGSVGQLLGWHYLSSHYPHFFGGRELAARVERRSARERWFWAGAPSPCQEELTLTPVAGGFLLDGRSGLLPGALVADQLVVGAHRTDTGEPLAVLASPAHPGAVCDHGWDSFGQRLSGNGSVEFDAVPIAARHTLGPLSTDDVALPPHATLASPIAQLISAQIALGIAEGALSEARDFLRAGTGLDHAPRSATLSTAYGKLVVTFRAAEELAARAVAELTAGLARGPSLTDDERGEIAVQVATARVAATTTALRITSGALEATGVHSTASHLGFDRFWRNARAHTLHEPADRALHEVGEHFLHGTHPPPAPHPG